MSQHTPGPWFYRHETSGGHHDLYRIHSAAADRTIGHFASYIEDHVPHEIRTGEANAALMAASPELARHLSRVVLDCRARGFTTLGIEAAAAFLVRMARAQHTGVEGVS